MLRKVLQGTTSDSPAMAVGLMLISLSMLSLQDALVKVVSDSTSLWQFQSVRAFLNLLLVSLIAIFFGVVSTTKPQRLRYVALRSLFHLLALFFFFSGAPFLTLAEMAGGLYTFPLFVVALSMLFLREKVGPLRIGGVIAGFSGTLLVLDPFSNDFSSAAVLPVLAGLCYGCFVITTRRLCRGESPVVLVIASNVAIILVGAIGWLVVAGFAATFKVTTVENYSFLLDVNKPITITVFTIFLVCAFCNTVANLFLGKAYQSADSSLLAPLDYCYLIFASFWGYVIWHDTPSVQVLTGMALIASSGIFIAWRERLSASWNN